MKKKTKKLVRQRKRERIKLRKISLGKLVSNLISDQFHFKFNPPRPVIPGTLQVNLNGVFLDENIDYTIDGDIIIFNRKLNRTDDIEITIRGKPYFSWSSF